MGQLIIETLSSGIRVASGGTRTSIKLDRAWQTDITIDPANCSFETRKQIEIASFARDGGWRVLENRYTPFPWHRLIIPESCWPKEEVRTLGGVEKIGAALSIASTMMRDEIGEFWFSVHVGPSAGQNIGHLHYHLLQPISGTDRPTRGDGVTDYVKSSSLVLSEGHGFKVVVGGCRAGQSFVVPLDHETQFADDEPNRLAKVLDYLITLCNKKFSSNRNMPPDYIIAVKFLFSRMVYASYIPILNQWGTTEYLGLLEGRPLILPWPHGVTLQYLKDC